MALPDTFWTRREFTSITHFAKIAHQMLAEFSDSDGVCEGFCPQPPEKINDNGELLRLANENRYYLPERLGIRFWAWTVRDLIL